MIKHTLQTIVHIDAFDLDALVNETYPAAKGNYSFAAWVESANGVSHEAGPIDGSEPDKFDREDFDKWGGSDYRALIEPNVHAILNDLCRRGLAPAGRYIIRVSW